jgi:hypothetical protein
MWRRQNYQRESGDCRRDHGEDDEYRHGPYAAREDKRAAKMKENMK